MSKGSALCSLLLLVVCVAQLPLISSSQLLPGGQNPNGDDDLLPCRDPIRRAPLMSIHGRDELDGHSSDSIFDDAEAEYGSVDGGVPAGRRFRADGEEDEGLLRDDDGGSGGTNSTKGSSGSGDVECPECGKFFRNDKSMFGHLRSHPNRGYKGAIPPVKKLKLSPAAAASSSCSLPGTDHRTPGRQHRSHDDPQLTPLEILCAYVLLTLKYRDSSSETTPQEVPRPPSCNSFADLDAIGGQAEGRTFGILDAIGGQAECGTGGFVASRNAAAEFKCNNIAGAEAGHNQLGNCDEQGYPVVKIPKKRRNMPKEVREAHHRKKPMIVLVPTPKPKEKRPYACKHCRAEFPTNQALGGHVAGHHRDKKAPRLNDHPSGMAAAERQNGKQQLKVEDGDDDDKELSLRTEQFSMALDNVPWQSGRQESGGHMKQHYGRRNDGLSPAMVVAPTPAPAHTDYGEASRLWDIDLNVEAPEQE